MAVLGSAHRHIRLDSPLGELIDAVNKIPAQSRHQRSSHTCFSRVGVAQGKMAERMAGSGRLALTDLSIRYKTISPVVLQRGGKAMSAGQPESVPL